MKCSNNDEVVKCCGTIVFIYRDNIINYLIVKQNDSSSGFWAFPKGHMAIGETEHETAIRETLEETGILVRIVEGFKDIIEFYLPDGRLKRVVLFLGRAPTNEVHCLTSELNDYRWLEFDKAFELITYNVQKNLLIKANTYLKREHNTEIDAWVE